MQGLHFSIEVDDHGKVKLEDLKKALDNVGDEGEKAGKKAKKGVMSIGDAAEKSSQKVKSLVTNMKVQLAGAAVAGGMGLLVKKGLEFNATLESTETQFTVIVGSATRAKQIMAELVEFSASTPFQLGEIANAARILEAFGIGGKASLTLVGDAAAAAQRPIEEVAMVFGRIKAGAFGEAFMRLAEMGLATRETLEGAGLQFDRAGSYVGSAEDALSAVQKIVGEKFGGMMQKQSETWKGAMSTLKDNWNVFAGALTRPLFEILKPKIKEATDAIQTFIASGQAEVWGKKIAEGVVTFTKYIKELGANVIDFVDKWGSAMFGVSIAIASFAALASLISTLTTVINGLKTAMAFLLANPWAIIAIGIGLIITGIAGAAKEMGGFGKLAEYVLNGIWENLKSLGGFFKAWGIFVAEVVKAAVLSGWDWFVDFFGKLKGWATDVGSILKSASIVMFKAITFQDNDAAAEYEKLKGMILNFATSTNDELAKKSEGRFAVAAKAWGEAMASTTWAEFKAGWENPENVLPPPVIAPAATGPVGPGLDATAKIKPMLGPLQGPGLEVAGDDYFSMGPYFPSADVLDAQKAIAEEKLKEFMDFTNNLYGGLIGEITFIFEDATMTLFDNMISGAYTWREAFTEVWASLKDTIISTSMEAAVAYIFNLGRMAVAKVLFEKKATAAALAGASARTTASIAETATSGAEMSADVGASAAKINKAHAGIPFVGPLIAASLIAIMLASMSKFAGGGLVPGAGSGIDDRRAAWLSGGEYVVTKKDVDRVGVAGLEAFLGGQRSGGDINLALTVNGGSITEAEIEEEIVPVLERLAQRRRLVI